MAQLVVITGPMAAGKNTTADLLVARLAVAGRTAVLADVDEVAAMVGPPDAAAAGVWFAAHEAHGAMVAQWLRSDVDVVVAVGPFHTVEEREALTRSLPDDAPTTWVVVDAPESVTLARAQADPTRGRSRERDFHHWVHSRFRELLPSIPADLAFDSSQLSADDIAAAIVASLDG